MKTVFKTIKPINPIKPIGITPLSMPSGTPIDRPKGSLLPSNPIDMGEFRTFETPVITQKNDGPVCSIEQLRNYQENWDKIIPPKVVKQLKRTGDIMHGSYSVNMQIPTEYHRQANDIDIWAKKPLLRANQMENAIDRCVGCDIAHVKEEKVGKIMPKIQTLGPMSIREKESEPEDQYKRYTVVTKPRNDVDVDYSAFPTDRPIRIRDVGGVRHETLDSALERAYEMQYRPLRAGRAREDIRRIESFIATRQGKKKWKETTLR